MGNIGSLLRHRKKATSVRRQKRKIHFETLEPRLLLDAITPEAETALVNGLQDFKDWTATLESYADLGQQLPLVNLSVGQLLDIDALVQEKLLDPLAAELDGDIATTATTENVVTILNGLAETSAVTGDLVDNEYIFNLTFAPTGPATATPLNLAESLNFNMGLDGSADLAVNAALDINFAFGYNVDSAEFFVRFTDFSANAQVNASDLDFDLRLGFLDTNVTGGTANLDAGIDLAITDPDNSDGHNYLTTTDLQNIIPESHLETALTGSASLDLPVSSSLTSTPQDLQLSWADLGDSSTVTTNIMNDSLEEFRNFLDISPETALSGLQSLPDMLDGITGIAALGQGLPVIGNHLADVVSVVDDIQGFIADLPDFSTAQGMQTALQAALDTLAPGNTVDMTVADNDLQFAFHFSKEFSQDIDFDLQSELNGLKLNLNGQLNAAGSVDTGIKFGLAFDTGMVETDRFYLLEGEDSFVDLAFKLITESPITATAGLGLINVGIENGEIAGAGRTGNRIDRDKDATARISLLDPGSGADDDGRITLTEILDAPLDIIAAPLFDAAIQAGMDIVPPIVSSANVHVGLDWYNIANPADVHAVFDSSALDDMLSSPGDLLNSDVLSEAAATGLRSLGTWFDSMVSATDSAPFNIELPLVNKTLAEIISLEDLLPQISTALLSFLDDPSATTGDFVSQVSSSLASLADSSPDMAINILSDRLFGGLLAAGDEAAANWLGYTPDADVLLFNVGFNLDKTLVDQQISLAGEHNSLGADFELPVTIGADLNLDFTFGYNLTDGMAVDDAFFVRLNELTAGMDINVTADFEVDLGMLKASVDNGDINFAAGVEITLANPDADAAGILTLEEISGTSPAGLVSFDITDSSLSARLPMQASLLGSGARATLVIAGDPLRGEAPDFHLEGTDFSDFSNFGSLTPASLLSGLDQIATLLSQIIGTDILNKDIPLIDVSISDVLDYGQAFSDQVTSLLYRSDGSPAFSDLDQLEELLNRVLVRATGVALPETGTLDSDAIFNIVLDGGAAIPVTLDHTLTSGFTSRQDLIDYINTTLEGISGLAGVSTGLTADGHITMNAPDGSSSFELTVDPADPGNSAFTALGFMESQVNGLSGLDVNFDRAHDLLLYTLHLDHSFVDFTTDFNFNRDLGPLGDITINDSSFSINAAGGLELTFGLDLSVTGSTLKALRPVDPSGRLDHDAHFELLLNGFADSAAEEEPSRIEVVLTSAATQTNSGVADLVADLNNSLRAALRNAEFSGDQIVAGSENSAEGDFITLSLQAAVAGSSLILYADADDPAVSDLGFTQSYQDSVTIITSQDGTDPNYLPADGRLSTTATFTLAVNGNDPVSISVSADSHNENRQDLVDDINQAINSRHLDNVLAELVGNRLAFTATGPEAQLRITAAADNTAVTELGLAVDMSQGPMPLNRIANLHFEGRALPENGQLSADATFQVSLNHDAPVTITVTRDSTLTGNGDDGTEANSCTRDIISNINQAIATAGLSGITAMLAANGHLSLTTTGADAVIEVTATADDPAVTELGMETSQIARAAINSQIAATSLLDQLVLDNLRLFGDMDIVGSLDAGADFAGLIGLTIDDAQATLHGGIDYNLFNAASPLRLVDLFENLSDLPDYLNFNPESLIPEGTFNFNLPVAVDGAVAGMLGLDETEMAMTISSGDSGNLFDFGSWDFDLSGLDALANFENFEMPSIFEALQLVIDFLRDIGEDTFLSKEIPLIDTSLNDVLDFTDVLIPRLTTFSLVSTSVAPLTLVHFPLT